MADSSFPRSARLLDADDFQAVFAQARYKVSNRHFLVLARQGARDCSRLGLVVAKKHVARAVQRNRLKRLIRTWFRQHRDFPAQLDIVVLVRKGAGELDNDTVGKQLAGLWRDLQSKLSNSAQLPGGDR